MRVGHWETFAKRARVGKIIDAEIPVKEKAKALVALVKPGEIFN